MTTKQNKIVRVTIRITEEEYILLSNLAKLTYSSGSLSRLIRYYLQPVFDSLKNVSSSNSPSS